MAKKKKTLTEETLDTVAAIKKEENAADKTLLRGIDTTKCILCRTNPPETNDGKENFQQNTCRACRKKHLEDIRNFESKMSGAK